MLLDSRESDASRRGARLPRWRGGGPSWRIAGLTLAIGACTADPEPAPRTDDLRVSEEVFRMFCLRVAYDAYPAEASGARFVPACEGRSERADESLPDDLDPRLVALLERRDDTVAALDQVFGEETESHPDAEGFAADELEGFLLELLPFYGEAGDSIIPRSTQALSAALARLIDPDDARGRAVLETLARLSPRMGYRPVEKVLAIVRPFLSYPRLDELSQSFLEVVAEGGAAHATFQDLLSALALELAEPKEQEEQPTTLRLVANLLLEPDPLLSDPTRTPQLVLDRDEEGNAKPTAGAAEKLPTPFRVAGRSDGVDRDPMTELAIDADGNPLFATVDANRTAVAAMLREGIPLLRRDGKDHSTLENLLRVVRPLLGESTQRTEQFGAAEYRYQGPNVEESAVSDLVHAFASLAALPEMEPLVEAIEQLLKQDESTATELVYAAQAIYDEAKKSEYDTAFLVSPDGAEGASDFWDDLIQIGERITERDGLWLEILRASQTPALAANGRLLANLMKHRDEVTLPGDDVNAKIVHTWTDPVDRALPDVGMNRSIWQRVLSMVHATYEAPNCNKQGAILTVTDPVPLTFPNPEAGDILIGGGLSLVCPPVLTEATYPRCAFIEQPSGAVMQIRSIIGRAKVVYGDEQVVCAAENFGVDMSAVQEQSSGITGFTTSPSAEAVARYVYAPRNKFLSDLFEPLPTVHGVPAVEFEPNLLYALEVEDPTALVGGDPQSFLTASAPLITAFDDHETIAEDGSAPNGYLFAELLQLLHMHWPSPQSEPCTPPITRANAGCSQHLDAAGPFYAHQSNLVSYEPLLIYALADQDLLGVLQRSANALSQVQTSQGDGLQALARFLNAALRRDAKLKYRDGRSWTASNRCQVEMRAGQPACNGDAGRIVQGVSPLYLLLDALKRVDAVWAEPDNEERHALWLETRSTLVDQFVQVEKADAGFRLRNRAGYAILLRLLSLARDRMAAHRADLASWAGGLTDRMAAAVGHPLAARGLDLFDELWEEDQAADEVNAMLTYMADEEAHPDVFAGVLVAAADTLMLFDRDPSLTPAIQFAALAIAPNVLDVIDGNGEPNVEEGAAYRGLELTRQIARLDDAPTLSTIGRLLKNAVLPIAADTRQELAGKSPLEVLIDVVAEVNRIDPTEESTAPLSAKDNEHVLDQLNQFLSNPERGLERLYQVIENRELH